MTHNLQDSLKATAVMGVAGISYTQNNGWNPAGMVRFTLQQGTVSQTP